MIILYPSLAMSVDRDSIEELLHSLSRKEKEEEDSTEPPPAPEGEESGE
jgi:hypothetical protein